MPRAPSRTTPAPGFLERKWEAGDSIPAPEAVHHDGDSGWAMWKELSQQHERRFADTAPLTQPPGMKPEEVSWAPTLPASGKAARARKPQARAAEPLFTLEGAMLVARKNNRVCPRPARWDEFTAMLPVRKTLRGVQQPPTAATGAAWAVTPPLTKRLCFREQIEWAERAGALESIMAFMQSLPEEEWLHMGES